MAIRVLLVEGQQMVREVLRDALSAEPDIDVVGEARDTATAQSCARSLEPDAVVLDDTLPDLNRLEAAAILKERFGGGARIVALSDSGDPESVAGMLRAGVSAFVTKGSAKAELVQAIRAVAGGQSYVCAEAAGALDERAGESRRRAPPITQRECEVLRLIADGTRSPEIAAQLHLSVATIEVHRRNIMRKLGLRTVAELTRYAIRERLVRL